MADYKIVTIEELEAAYGPECWGDGRKQDFPVVQVDEHGNICENTFVCTFDRVAP